MYDPIPMCIVMLGIIGVVFLLNYCLYLYRCWWYKKYWRDINAGLSRESIEVHRVYNKGNQFYISINKNDAPAGYHNCTRNISKRDLMHIIVTVQSTPFVQVLKPYLKKDELEPVIKYNVMRHYNRGD